MAKNQLKVDVVVNAKTKQLDNLIKKFNKAATATNRLTVANNKLASSGKQVINQHKKSASAATMLTGKLKKLANAYLGVMAARALITSSDNITSAENKLNHINATNLGAAGYSNGDYSQATLNATQESMDKMYTSAQKVRVAYTDMMRNVSKSMTLAGDAFGGNIDNAIRFQEIMGEAYALSGASAAEMSSSMYQMIQGLGSGILQGDELRSVREGASMAYQAIEEYAQGIYGAETNLKDLASQGKITSDIVVAAILENGEKLDEAFARTEMTFAQAWTKIKNTALKSFEPVLQKLNNLLNSDVGQSIINGIGRAIQIVAGVLLVVFNIVEKTFNFIKTYWGIISNVLLAMLVISIPLIMYKLTLLGIEVVLWIMIKIEAVKAGLSTAMAWAIANWQMLLIIIVIALVIIAVIKMADSFEDACGMIVGAVYWLGATLWNIVVGVINGIIQFLWTYFVEPWIGIIEWVLNVFNGGFNSFGDAVKNLLSQIISWFLSLGKVVTKIIDAIFGTNWTSGLNSLQSSILKWGKNEQAITLSREAPEVLNRVSATDAYSKGYDVGYGMGEQIKSKLNLTGLPNLGLDTSAIDSLDNIDGNTGKIADSVELAEEDLAYLRDLAHMEWKKEFTTASITVDMSNYNTINGENDLDGIVTKLADKLYEEMNVVANGVYA